MEEKIRMISAAAEVIESRKQNPLAIDEEIFQHLLDYISKTDDIKNEKIKIYMVAAASKAFEISRKDPKLTEKEVLREVMNEIPDILLELDEEEKVK